MKIKWTEDICIELEFWGLMVKAFWVEDRVDQIEDINNWAFDVISHFQSLAEVFQYPGDISFCIFLEILVQELGNELSDDDPDAILDAQ